MATVEIPIDGNYASQQMNVRLEQVRYRIRVHYTFRPELWVLDLFDDEGNVILGGVSLVQGWQLLGQHKTLAQPPGELRLVDTLETGEKPGRWDFGRNRRVRLYYDESEDAEAVG